MNIFKDITHQYLGILPKHTKLFVRLNTKNSHNVNIDHGVSPYLIEH